MVGGGPLDLELDHGLVDAFLYASRALVAIAARSLAETDVSVTQFRVLVLVASRGPQRPSDIAESLSVAPSSATRLCQRLEDRGLLQRETRDSNRREVWLRLSTTGFALVQTVSDRRRGAIADVLAAMGSTASRSVIQALETFARASGEIPEDEWSWGRNGLTP